MRLRHRWGPLRSTMRPLPAVLVAMLVWTSALAQQQQQNPEEYAKFLEGAERVARMQVPRVIGALELAPGMKVADLGSGSGLFTRPIARAVSPGGVAYAVDINPALLKIVARSASEASLTKEARLTRAASFDWLDNSFFVVYR